jgi:hypothetical protein
MRFDRRIIGKMNRILVLKFNEKHKTFRPSQWKFSDTNSSLLNVTRMTQPRTSRLDGRITPGPVGFVSGARVRKRWCINALLISQLGVKMHCDALWLGHRVVMSAALWSNVPRSPSTPQSVCSNIKINYSTHSLDIVTHTSIQYYR